MAFSSLPVDRRSRRLAASRESHRMTDDEKRVQKPEDGEIRYNDEDVGPVITLKLVLNSGPQLWLKFRP